MQCGKKMDRKFTNMAMHQTLQEEKNPFWFTYKAELREPLQKGFQVLTNLNPSRKFIMLRLSASRREFSLIRTSSFPFKARAVA